MPSSSRRFCTLGLLAAATLLVALAVALAASDGAEAGGSGDYPPPASGTWYINQPTSVWSEAITLKGSLYIYAPLTMNLVNLTFDSTANPQYSLYVTTSGSLTFTNGNITSSNPNYHYQILAYNTTTIRNSELSEAYYGVQSYTKLLTLTDNKIFDMYTYGVYMVLPYTLKGNVLIKGNDIISNRNYGIYIYQYASVNRVDFNAIMTGDITISNNKFRDNLGGGVYIYRYMYAYYSHEEMMFTNLTIENNEMIANRGYSVYVYTYLYNYQGIDDGKITYKGAINVNNNTIRDSTGYYAVYYRNSISIYYGSDALIDSDVNMVGNVITGNKGAYAIYFYNSIYEYYGRDAKVRIDLRMEANNISDNGGHAVFIDSYSNTQYGDTGVCTNDGDIIFKDNTILDNLGSGVYLYRLAYADLSSYSSITGNTVFEGNNIRNNQGYGGAYLYSYCHKNRGDENGTASIKGDVTFVNNTFINNLGYGAYVLHYTRSYYGSDSTIEGDVQFRGNTINKNTGYGAYIYFDAYKSYGVTTGTAKIISNATFLYNTMSGNSGAHGFYYFKYARCYYSSHSTLNGTVTAEGNTIEDNKGYGIYIYAYSYNYRGALGNTFITGDIWVRDNTIRRNGGGGIYLYCYSYSYDAKSADVYQNISFARNTVSNNGYHGFVVSVTGYSNRAVGGDTNVVGDISYIDNKVNSNQYTGIYFSRSAAADYTAGTGVYIIGDVRIEGNEANSNYNYGITVSNSVRNSQAGLSGRSELRSDYIVRNNTVKNNLYWIAMNLQRTVSAYYTGTAVLDSDMFLEDNVVQGNRGIGVRIVDNCDQYYYGGAGNPDRGSFTQKGQMDILRNSIDTNAGDGLNINATIDAAIRVIEPAPRIMDNSISYNGGNFGFYCDLRDITKPITITNNTIEHNEVQYVALISNSGTAPDLLFKDNRIRYNNVEHTILGLIVGDGDYNATFTKNNVSYNDADELVLAFVSKGLITVSENTFMGNTNATDVIVIRGQSNESVISVTSNIVVQNSGNGINVDTLGKLTVRNNEVRFNTGTGVIATTNVGLEVIEAVIDVIDNTITDNDGNGVWSVSMNSLSVTDNSILRNGFAGIRVNAMREKPVLTDNTITGNKWGLYLTGDNLAPLTTTYNFQDLTITGSTHEGLYAEDLTIQVRSCIITGSANADLAVRRARIDCYSTDVGYASGHVYESGHIKVWWRVDIDVEWQSGVTVPNAHVTMVADYDNRTYRELETDYDGHIATFNVEEWSMIDQAVYRWSPFRCTATKNAESSTQVETVDQSRTILIILRDVHVPSMVILEPLEDALLNYSIVRVSGTASDEGSGLSTVRVRLDDGLWDDLGKVKAFTKLLPVPDGKHVISVQGEDVAGVLATVSVNITIDTVLPRFMLVYPTEGLLTNTSLIEVEGRVLEPGLEVTVNDLPQKVGADNVFKDVIRLFEGPNVIKVWARDAAGNQRLLVVNLTLDTIAPMLSVDSPPDHHLTREPTLTLVGRSEPGADILVGPVTGEAGSGGAFSMAVELVEGANTLAVTARDAAGNSATVFIHVRLDTMPPFLTIEEPEDGLLTRDDKVRVVGAVEDEDGMVLSVGGSFALPSEGRYNHTVDLVEGKNLVVVTARDVAGNEAKVNITVTRRTNPPLLQVTRPSYDYLVTNEVQYRIEGVTDPDVVLTVGDTTIAVDPSGNFTREVQLKSGENVVSIVASDVLGNVASTVVHLILDTEPPTLVVDFPIDGYITEEIGLNVSGRTDVGSDLTINGEEVPTDDKGRFSVRYDLMLGRQNLTILAKDQAGNEAAVKLWVERTEPVEPSEPVEPPTLGGSTAAIIVAVLVGGIAAAVGYMYLQKRRQQAD